MRNSSVTPVEVLYALWRLCGKTTGTNDISNESLLTSTYQSLTHLKCYMSNNHILRNDAVLLLKTIIDKIDYFKCRYTQLYLWVSTGYNLIRFWTIVVFLEKILIYLNILLIFCVLLLFLKVY